MLQRYAQQAVHNYTQVHTQLVTEYADTHANALAACIAEFEEEELYTHLYKKLHTANYIMYVNAQNIEVAYFNKAQLTAHVNTQLAKTFNKRVMFNYTSGSIFNV